MEQTTITRRTAIKAGMGAALLGSVASQLPGGPAAAAVYNWYQRGPMQSFAATFAFNASNHVLIGGDDATGVWKSTTGATDTWLKLTTQHDFTGWAIALKPTDNNVILSGDAYGRGILRSTDGGATWSRANSGLPTGTLGQKPFFTWLHWSIHSANTVYAAARRDDANYPTDAAGAGLWKSTDGGISWTKIAVAALGGKDVECVWEAASSASILLVGVGGRLYGSPTAAANGIYRSTDGGATWSGPTYSGSPIMNFVGHPLQAGKVWAAVYGQGVAVSSNNGSTWSIPAGQPAGSKLMWMLAGDPSTWHATNPARLFSCVPLPDFTAGPPYAWTPLYKSTDSGATWSATGLPTDLWTISVGVNNNGHVYCGTYDGGVWKSTDNGTSFSDVSNGLSMSYVYRQPEPRVSTASVLAGTHWSVHSASGSPLTNRVIVRRTTATGSFGNTAGITPGFIGNTWQIARYPAGGQNVWAAVGCSDTGVGGVWKSTDDGQNWTHLGAGALDGLEVISITANPANGQLWAGIYSGAAPASQGLRKSTDGGVTWTNPSATMNGKWITSITFDPKNNSVMYACTGGSNFGTNLATGLWKSTNGGTTWTQVSYLTSRGFYTLGFAPWDATQNEIYVAHEGGLSRSTDNGATWVQPAATTTTGVTQANPGINRSADKGSFFVIDSSTYVLYYCGNNYYGLPSSGVIWQSNDGGFKWLELSPHYSSGSTISTKEVWGLSVDPGKHLYAATFGSGVWELDLI